jgi:striatin 1/3/4
MEAGSLGDEEVLDSTLGLGELAQLTVNNEAEAAYDVSHNSLYVCVATW